MIIADEATGRKAPPMMGYRLHIPNVHPQVNSLHLKSLTSPCMVTMEALPELSTSHAWNKNRDMLPDLPERKNTRLPPIMIRPTLLRLPLRNTKVHLLHV